MCVRFNAEADPALFAVIAANLGIADTRAPELESALALADHLEQLAQKVGVPRGLAELGVHDTDVPVLARNAMADACITTNPRAADEAPLPRAVPGGDVRPAPDLERLTGVRSGKLDVLSGVPGCGPAHRTRHRRARRDPARPGADRERPGDAGAGGRRGRQVHLGAEWVLLALADECAARGAAAPPHPGLRGPPLLVRRPFRRNGIRCRTCPTPCSTGSTTSCVGSFGQFRLPVIELHHAHVPIELDGGVIGAFAAWTPSHRTLDSTDETVMRILSSQTAVALHNCASCSSVRRRYWPSPRRATPSCRPPNAN